MGGSKVLSDAGNRERIYAIRDPNSVGREVLARWEEDGQLYRGLAYPIMRSTNAAGADAIEWYDGMDVEVVQFYNPNALLKVVQFTKQDAILDASLTAQVLQQLSRQSTKGPQVIGPGSIVLAHVNARTWNIAIVQFVREEPPEKVAKNKLMPYRVQYLSPKQKSIQEFGDKNTNQVKLMTLDSPCLLQGTIRKDIFPALSIDQAPTVEANAEQAKPVEPKTGKRSKKNKTAANSTSKSISPTPKLDDDATSGSSEAPVDSVQPFVGLLGRTARELPREKLFLARKGCSFITEADRKEVRKAIIYLEKRSDSFEQFKEYWPKKESEATAEVKKYQALYKHIFDEGHSTKDRQFNGIIGNTSLGEEKRKINFFWDLKAYEEIINYFEKYLNENIDFYCRKFRKVYDEEKVSSVVMEGDEFYKNKLTVAKREREEFWRSLKYRQKRVRGCQACLDAGRNCMGHLEDDEAVLEDEEDMLEDDEGMLEDDEDDEDDGDDEDMLETDDE